MDVAYIKDSLISVKDSAAIVHQSKMSNGFLLNSSNQVKKERPKHLTPSF
mgnify:CR=1 FL=1